MTRRYFIYVNIFIVIFIKLFFTEIGYLGVLCTVVFFVRAIMILINYFTLRGSPAAILTQSIFVLFDAIVRLFDDIRYLLVYSYRVDT